MNPDIIADYNEARTVAQLSPRSAAALLRLCLQKLLKQLAQPGKDIYKETGVLVEKGLPRKIQQALDIVRIAGNSAVHPSEIDLKDDIKTVETLFILINQIAYDQITQPREIDELFNNLPQGQLLSIEKRDNKPTTDVPPTA